MPERNGARSDALAEAGVVPCPRRCGDARAARRAIRFALCAGLLSRGSLAAEVDPSPAVEAPADRAAVLFDEGVAAIKAGNFETACPALEQSYALEASLGTLLALANCLERWQRLASASARYAQFIDAVARASHAEAAYRADQVAFARTALARLEPQIPRLELMGTALLPSDVRVLLDGRELDASGREGELALDPGRHVLETLAPGHEPWRVELELGAGERKSSRLEVGALVPAPPLAPEPLPTVSSSVVSQPASAGSVGDHETSGSAWRTVGWGLGGLGLASVAVGAVAGTLLLDTCPGLDCAEHEERGKRLALVTDVGLGLGVAALISSVIVLVNTEPPAKARDGVAGFEPVGAVHLRGGWLGMSRSF